MAIDFEKLKASAKKKDEATYQAAKADFAQTKPLVTAPQTATPKINIPTPVGAMTQKPVITPQSGISKTSAGVGVGYSPPSITNNRTPLDPINANPAVSDKIAYVGGRAISGATGMAKGVVNEIGYKGQQADFARNTAQEKLNNAITSDKPIAKQSFSEINAELKTAPLTPLVNWGANYDKNLNQFAVERGYDKDKGLQTIGNVAQGLGGMVPAAVANILVPGSSLYVMATGAAGNATEQALARGASTVDALDYGAAVGVTEAVTEKLFDGMSGLFGKGAADDVGKALAKRLAKDETTQKAITMLANTLGEGLEEWLTEYAEAYENKILINQDSRNFAQLSSDALYSGAIGSLTSLVMQGGNVANISGKDAGEMAANQTLSAQPVINNVQNGTPNVQNNVVAPNLPKANFDTTVANESSTKANTPQQAVQSPTIEVKPQTATDTEKAVEASTEQQAKPEAQTQGELQEQYINSLREQQAEIEAWLNTPFALDSPAETRKYENQLTKVNAEIDKAVEEERRAAVKTPLKTIIDNLDKYRRSDLESLAEQLSGGNGDGYEDFSRAELEESLRDLLNERAGDFTTLELQAPKYGLFVRPIETPQAPIFPENSLGAKITNLPQGTGAVEAGFDKLGAMVDKYGAIPQGENPHSTERVTEERMPKRTADDNLVSQTARTAYEAPVTTNETAGKIEEAVLADLFSYKKLTDKTALDYADKVIAEKGYDNALSDWREDIHDGKVGKKLTAVGWKLYNEAAKAGKGQQAVEILVDISRSTRNGAQATQAVSLLKKMSPEYQLYAVQRSVQRMNDDMSRDNEKQQEKISGAERRKADVAAEKMAEVVNEESAKVADDVVEELAKSVKRKAKSGEKKKSNLNPLAEKTDAEKAAEKLAGKVAATTKERKPVEVNAINDMVNELFKSAKESPLPEQAPRPKRSPIEFLTQAIQNKAEYTDVWNNAKEILLEKYSGNPEVLNMLNDYFEKGIVPTYSDATLTASVKQALKDLDTKLSTIKELSWTDRQRAIKAVTNYLVEQTGAVDGDAKALKRDAADKLTMMIIDSAPKLTAKQKLEIKQATQDALRKHGVPVESWSDETGRLIAEGISKKLAPAQAPAPKAITNIITDDIKKFVGTLPKPIKTVVSRNAIDRYTDFMENRQYYTEAWAKLQSELKTKYANNPEALKAIDTIINRNAETAATDYYNKELDGMINKALKSINVKLSELVTQGKASKDATIKAVTDILINESSIDSETAKTVSENITDRFNEMLKERSAKRLSAMFPSKTNDISEKRSLENKLESLINVGAFDSKAFNSIAAERVLGIKEVTISPKLADAFVQAKTEEARAEALDNIYRDVAAQVPATFKDKFDAWRYTAMLFNPITHIKNIGGNYAFSGERSMRNVLSASVQTAANTIAHNLGGKGFEQTRAIALTKADKALIMDADADYTKFSEEIYKVGKFDDVKSKINDYRTIFGRGGKTAVGNFLSKTVGVGVEKARTTNSAELDIEDTWVSRPAYVNALAGYLKANKVNFQTADPALIERARSFAIDEARKAAYRDFNAFSNWVSTVGRGRVKNGFTKVVQMESEGILPFRRTLANILVRAGEYSPIGLFKTITYDSYRLARGEIEPAEYIDNMAEGLTGTSLVALGMFLGAQGILTYGASGDDKEDKLHETQGKQHFSINVAGKSYTVDWLSPFIVPIFMGVAINNLVTDTKDDGVKFDDVLKIATDITDPILELSMMSSLNDYIEGFSAAKQQDQNLIWYGITQGALGYLGQAVPTIGGRIARTIDPTRRTSFTDPTNGIPDDIEYFAQTQLGKIPFAASTKQPYVDQWGRTQESGSFVGRFAQNFLSPGYLKDVNVSPMEKEIERLYEDYGKENEVNVLPPVTVRKYFANNGEDVYMTADEYTKFKITSGQTAYSELTKLTSSAEYKAMTDADKAKAVSDIYAQSAEKAKTQVMEARGDMRLPNAEAGAKVEAYKSAGISEKQAYSLYKEINSLNVQSNTNAGKYEIISTINKQGLTPKQQAALVATLYTSHDDNGNVTDESLLPYISNSARLLSLYTQSKGENTAMINMTIPKSFSKSNVEYELTDAEKKLYKDTYIQYFNMHITSVSTDKNVEYYSGEAATRAKNAIINGRK